MTSKVCIALVAMSQLATLEVQGASFITNSAADAGISERLAADPQGANPSAISGKRGTTANEGRDRALFRFDLTGIPLTAVVTSVVLTLEVTMHIPSTPVSSMFGLHRLLVNWSEEAATWIRRNATVNWSLAGAQSGVDFVADSGSSTFISTTGSYTFASSPALVADVQRWVSAPATNFGWILISESEETPYTARHFGTKESISQQPVLRVEYSLPGLGPRISDIAVNGRLFTFRFSAATGQGYRVESKPDLTGGNWTTLTNIAVQSGPQTVVITDSTAASGRFYRVAIAQ